MAQYAAASKVNNPLNTYTGPDALIKYYDPDCQPPLPLVELPDRLNPFRAEGVRIYAKMMTMLPAHNVKMLPGMVREFFRAAYGSLAAGLLLLRLGSLMCC